jgi:hypothetical protein
MHTTTTTTTKTTIRARIAGKKVVAIAKNSIHRCDDKDLLEHLGRGVFETNYIHFLIFMMNFI